MTQPSSQPPSHPRPTSRPPSRRRPDQRQTLGRAGEAHVVERYEELGFTVLDRNWRDGRRGELDLVLRRGALVVACEVKTRRSDAYGDPLEAVTPTKQARLRRLAYAWLEANRHRLTDVHGRVDVRIDVAAVRLGRHIEVEIIEAAC